MTYDATIDVSSIAQPREATFRFVFNGPVTTTGLRSLLAAISKKHNIDLGYVMISQRDYKVLKEDLLDCAAMTIMHDIYLLRISNEHTGNSCRVVVSPDIEAGSVTFGVLYAPLVASVVDADSPTSGQTLVTMPS
jgi:hypothetical protein